MIHLAKRTLTLATAVIAIGVGGFAIAAPDAPITPPPTKSEHRHHDPADRAQKIREKLSLTPGQEPALQALLASMKPHPTSKGARTDHAARAQQRQVAIAKFRTQLTSDQKAKFDQMLMKREERRRHRVV